jgi:nicotinamidase-related amidase
LLSIDKGESEWELKRRTNMKKTLIVIDMQNDFIDGSLGTAEAQAIVDNVKNKIKKYQSAGDQIIFTRDTHQSNYLETNEGKHLPVEHCIEGTKGWQIAEGLEVSGAIYIDKPSFGYLDWKQFDLEEVEMVGLCTDICVVSNALIIKATYPEIRVSVDASCCAGVTPESHEAALTTMKMCQVEVER